MARGQLRRLTSLRWFAALLVFADHLGQQIDDRPIYLVFGYAGVGLFFVLSGIVLTWSSPQDDTLRHFYRRRFARIYPATMAASALAVIIVATGNGFASVESTVSGAVLFVLLLQAWRPFVSGVAPWNGPVWTLSVEAFFYAVFPPINAVLARISQRCVVAGASLVVLATVVASVPASRSIDMHMPLMRLSEFVVGMAIGTGLRRGWVPRISIGPALIAYAGLMVVALGVECPWLVLLPGAAAVLCAAAGADLRGETSWLTCPKLVYLGQVSFCFYLIHQAVLHGAWDSGARGLALLISLPLGLVVAMVLHHGVELPVQRLILRPPGARDPRPLHDVSASNGVVHAAPAASP